MAEKIVKEGWAEKEKVWEIKGGIMGWRKEVDSSLAEY